MIQFLKEKKRYKISTINLEYVREIREEVLYLNFSKSYARYEFDKHLKTIHYGLSRDDEIISILSLIENPCKYFLKKKTIQIRGMATKLAYQRKGFGSILLEEVKRKMYEFMNYEILWCNSRLESIKFYEKNGFTATGDKFTIRDIGLHKVLYYKINKSQKIQNFIKISSKQKIITKKKLNKNLQGQLIQKMISLEI